MTAIRIMAIPPATLSVEALAPWFDQGLTNTSPKPATSWIRNSVKAADATPPARIAPQATADLEDSSGMISVCIATTSAIAATPLACPGGTLHGNKAACDFWFRGAGRPHSTR